MGLGSWITDKFLRVERNKLGGYSYWFGGKAFGSKMDFLQWSMENPVLMTVISLRSKLYSEMEITAEDKDGNKIDIPELQLLHKPNYFQSKQDFLFQQMWFLSAVGECYTYQKRLFSNDVPKAMYNLIPCETDFKDVLKITNFITDDKDIRELEKQTIEYKLDKQKYNLKLKDIIPLYDLANGMKVNSLMRSPSRVEGLVNVLQNISVHVKS